MKFRVYGHEMIVHLMITKSTKYVVGVQLWWIAHAHDVKANLHLLTFLLLSICFVVLKILVKIQNGDDIWPNLRRFSNQFMKVGGIKTWKELTIGAQQLVRLLFINPRLFLYDLFELINQGELSNFSTRLH